MVIVPASASAAIVLPSANVGAGSGVAVSPPPASPPPEEQPASVSAPAAASASRVSRVLFMSYQSFAVSGPLVAAPRFVGSWPRCSGRGVSVLEDLRQEVLRPLALGVCEE